ncbi:MAG: hypothetical protein ACOVNQ_09585, partial [Pirellula sp.]
LHDPRVCIPTVSWVFDPCAPYLNQRRTASEGHATVDCLKQRRTASEGHATVGCSPPTSSNNNICR